MIGLSLADHRLGVGPVQGLDLRGQPFPDPSYGLLARLDEQLAVAVAADVEPEEVKASIEVTRRASCPR